jgi:hypothetical protein
MIVPAPREILITKENKFTMDIHNDKADDIVQHQKLERKHYNVDMKRQTVTRSQWDNKKGYNLLILVG